MILSIRNVSGVTAHRPQQAKWSLTDRFRRMCARDCSHREGRASPDNPDRINLQTATCDRELRRDHAKSQPSSRFAIPYLSKRMLEMIGTRVHITQNTCRICKHCSETPFRTPNTRRTNPPDHAVIRWPWRSESLRFQREQDVEKMNWEEPGEDKQRGQTPGGHTSCSRCASLNVQTPKPTKSAPALIDAPERNAQCVSQSLRIVYGSQRAAIKSHIEPRP